MKKLKKQFIQLRNLLNDWHPLELPVPVDEYDCLLYPLLSLLHQKSSKIAIIEYLIKEFYDHFGIELNEMEAAGFTEKLINWYLDNQIRTGP